MKRELSDRQRAVLKRHAFKPGHPPVPGAGRPPSRILTSSILRELQGNDENGECRADVVARGLVAEASGGSHRVAACALLLDRLEGRTPASLNLGGEVTLHDGTRINGDDYYDALKHDPSFSAKLIDAILNGVDQTFPVALPGGPVLGDRQELEKWLRKADEDIHGSSHETAVKRRG